MLTATAIALLFLGCAKAQQNPAPAVTRVVAVGDLHGDPVQAEAVLRLAGLLDADGHWAGQGATLVQTGDTTDRGPDSRGVLELMRRLEAEAKAAGGRVVPLLGNHEAMNLQGDWRYVSPEDVAGFGGVEARRTALGAEGVLGRWLRGLDAVALIEGTVFVHGGVHPTFAARGVEGLNEAVRGALKGGGGDVLGPEGPLWYRGFVVDPEEQACPRLDESLRALGARRMVVGHTTRREGRVQTRCGGRLTVIDVGIGSGYGGNLAAWEAVDGDARVIYANGTIDVVDPP